jgi:hypothetical protein
MRTSGSGVLRGTTKTRVAERSVTATPIRPRMKTTARRNIMAAAPLAQASRTKCGISQGITSETSTSPLNSPFSYQGD